MAENAMVQQQYTTTLSEWAKTYTNLVTEDYTSCGLTMSDYSKTCAMSAMTTIYQMLIAANVNLNTEIDISNLREVVGQAASLKLNANAVPRECYFQLRKKQIGGKWLRVVEMGIEGDGYDSLLRNFGSNVKQVYPVWIVHEGDDFTYPIRRGIEVKPPEWTPKGLSDKAILVCYPVALQDGTIEYLISERSRVKTNLFAHIRNNLMNETFGIAESKYKACAEQKKKIDEQKSIIYEALRKCQTVEDMLACDIAKPYISPAWLDTPESMIVRKMRNNAIKGFKKNYDTMANRSYLQLDETYQQAQTEIEDGANKIEFMEVGEVDN